MDDGRRRLGGGVGLESVRVRVVLWLSKREDRAVSPPALFSCEDKDARARGLSEMARSPEWNKLEYSTPVAQSFAFNQDIVRVYERPGRAYQKER